MTATCFHPTCSRGPVRGDTLYRINAKGKPGVWACEEHLANTDAPRDPELNRLVTILERGLRK
jgi:hypothetical protein